MRTEIPPDEWESFCESFGRQHRHWLVVLGELPSALAYGREPLDNPGARLVARELALQAIRARRAAGAWELQIIAGEGGEQICHTVALPRCLWLEETGSGAHRGLRIDSEGGLTTVLRFRAAVAPESVDGLGP